MLGAYPGPTRTAKEARAAAAAAWHCLSDAGPVIVTVPAQSVASPPPPGVTRTMTMTVTGRSDSPDRDGDRHWH